MWETEKLKKFSQRRKVDLSLKKNTYIEQIETQQLKRKSPGISTYKLQKSMKEIEADLQKIKKKKQSVGEKFYFYQNTEALSDRVPGVGHYCPRVP